MTGPAPSTCRLEGLTKRYGRLRAVDAITVDIAAGITGLLGPNGAGKTTLLGLLATLQAPDGGRLRLLGLDPAEARQRVEIRRQLGYLPQEPGFHRRFTVFDFVDYVAILKEHTDRRARHAEVERVIDVVGLRDRADARIRTLSGGMRRRVALAQALLGDPALLLLDEPTAGLDPEQRLRFRDLISRLGEDRTVLVSTHQTEDVAAMCQRVLVLHAGQVRFAGAPSDLMATATEHVWVATSRDPRAVVAWRTGDGRFRHIGDAPEGAETVPPTLEDAYLLLLGGDAPAALDGAEVAA
jgi:ABC-2 type transport system ATP-binding protein